MLNVEEGSVVRVEWNDGSVIDQCLFLRRDRGFFLFFFDNNVIVARPASIKIITEIKNE